MGHRKKQSGLEDMLDIAAALPWQVAVVLAIASFVGLHYWATTTEIPPKDLAGLGGFAGRQLYRVLAMYLQYLIPGILVLGAIISKVKASRLSKRYENTQALGTRAAIADISWQEFEGLVGEHFRRQGYQVKRIGGNGPDGGVDLEIDKDGENFLVQCKRWRALKVGVDVVRELYGVMASRGAIGAFVVTSGEFTPDAKAFCEGRNISLVDGNQLVATMRAGKGAAPRSPTPEFIVKVEVSDCPKCKSPMVKRIAKQGPRAGESFWGCSNYPRCSPLMALRAA